MAIKATTMSRDGFNKLQEELEYLVTIRRKEVADKLKEARSYGDLSENAEYDEAKNEQGMLEAQIADLEAIIANAIYRVRPRQQQDIGRISDRQSMLKKACRRHIRG